MFTDEQLAKIKEYTKKRKKSLKFPTVFKEERTIFDIPISKIEIEPDKSVKQELNKAGFEIVDYLSGTAKKTTDSKNIFKIGKVLNKLHKTDLIKKFEQRTKGTLIKDYEKYKYKLIITYKPEDVAGMSTNKNWTSCTDLKNGCNSDTALDSISLGNLMAYLIKEKDLEDIDKSLARIMIKRFTSKTFKNNVVFLAENRIYGDEELAKKLNMSKILNEILEQHNSKFKKKCTYFRCDPDGYSDTYGSAYTFLSIKQALDRIVEKRWKKNSDETYDINCNYMHDCLYDCSNPIASDEFLIKFNKINGDFRASNMQFISMKNCPEIVKGSFDFSGNNISSLEGCPKIVEKDFYLQRNNEKVFSESAIRKICKVKGNVYV